MVGTDDGAAAVSQGAVSRGPRGAELVHSMFHTTTDVAIYNAEEAHLREELVAREEAELGMVKAIIGAVFSTRKPRDAFAGTASGLKTVARGLGIGLASLVVQPYLGAKSGGPKGFMKGVGTGVATCAASAVCGTLVATGQIVRGVANTPSAVVYKAKGKVWNASTRAWEKDWYSLPEEAAEVLGSPGDPEGQQEASSSSSSQKPRRKVADTALYDLLEVSPEATEAEIRKAFYKKSLALHPDKNPGRPEVTQKFQAVSEAYQILGDQQKRRDYDDCGKDSVLSTLPKIEPAVFFAALFGSHHLEPYVGRLRMALEIEGDLQLLVRDLVATDEEGPSLDLLKVKRALDRLGDLERRRQVSCALNLAARLAPVAGEAQSQEVWAAWERERREEAAKLANEAPIGAEMLYLVGWMYVNRASQFFAGNVLKRLYAKLEGKVHWNHSKLKLAGTVGKTLMRINSIAKSTEKKQKEEQRSKAEADAQKDAAAAQPSSDASAPGEPGEASASQPAAASAEAPVRKPPETSAPSVFAPAAGQGGDDGWPPPPEVDPQRERFPVGSLVVIHGLTNAPELNNEVGIVSSYDVAAGRYVVNILPVMEVKAFRPENLSALEEAQAGSDEPHQRRSASSSSSAPPPSEPKGPGAGDAPGPGAEEGWAPGGEDAEVIEALKASMPLFHDSLWTATALDVEYTLSLVVQKVLRDMSVEKTVRQRRAQALLRLGVILQEPLLERERQAQQAQQAEAAQQAVASPAEQSPDGQTRRSRLSGFKPSLRWSSSKTKSKDKGDDIKQKRMEAALAMMATGASAEDVDDMLAARAAMEAELQK